MVRIGVICPSEIAMRRFMPALMKVREKARFAGVGVASLDERAGIGYKDSAKAKAAMANGYRKAKEIINLYGGKIYDGYQSMVEDDEIDALYIPLPPALHYMWGKRALEHGKHIFLEKPATVCLENTKELLEIAGKRQLAVHENYMFIFHNQISEIDQLIRTGRLGEVRLYQICFGFPRRAATDFRYMKELGGGALYDAGGYTIKYASMLLGETGRVVCAQMNYTDDCEVDLYGSGTLVNNVGDIVQVSFGMDNSYMCRLEVWGSKGQLMTGRVLTAPVGFAPEMIIKTGDHEEVSKLPGDDAFEKSIRHFLECIDDKKAKVSNYKDIFFQAKLMDEFRKKAME